MLEMSMLMSQAAPKACIIIIIDLSSKSHRNKKAPARDIRIKLQPLKTAIKKTRIIIIIILVISP
jgi:hypothetical protein